MFNPILQQTRGSGSLSGMQGAVRLDKLSIVKM